MAGFGPFLATGSTIVFSTSNFTANVIDIDLGGVKREHKDSTYLGTTVARTFVPVTLYDGGEVTLKIQFAANKAATIPIAGATETVTITFANTGSATAAFSAFVVEYKAMINTETIVEGDIKLKVTGAITWGGQS